MRRRRLNWKLIAIVVAVTVVAIGGALAVHKHRRVQAVKAAREQAFKAAERGETDQAITLMETYIAVYRHDATAMRELALLLDRTGKLPGDRVKVLYTLDRALQMDASDQATRRLAVTKALELRRFKDAHDHLAILVRDTPNDAVLEQQLGECAEGLGQSADAIRHYERSIALDRTQVEAYARQARLLRLANESDRGDALMRQLRRVAPGLVPARLAVHRYFRESGRAADAQTDIERAVALAPDSAEVRLEAALHEFALGRVESAEQHVRAGLIKNPDDLPLVKLRVELERRAGPTRSAEVRDQVRRTLKLLDANPRKTADVLDLLIDVEELALARDVLRGPRNEWLPGHVRDFLDARIKIVEEDYVRARELLERCRAQLAPAPEFAREANLLLGVCQRRLGNPEQAARSIRTALELSPAWVPAQLELAAAHIERGQFDEALVLYRKLIPQVPEARLIVARLLLDSVMRRLPEQRDWTAVEELVMQAPPEQQKTAEWHRVHNSLLLAQGKNREAREELEAAIAGEPNQPAPRVALAALLARNRDFDNARAILDRAQREIGDRVEIRLALANLAVQSDQTSAAPAIARLADGVEGFSRADQVTLLSGLYRISQGTESRLSRRLADRLAILLPTRIDLRFGMLRLALAENDEPAANILVNKLRELEGEGGAYWRCGAAAAKLQFGPAGDQASMADARINAAEAARLRPDWGLPVFLLGELEERQNNPDAALPRYRSAIELGERSPLVVRRAVQLLQKRGRFDEAQELLRRLGTFLTSDVELARQSLAAMIGRESPEHVVAKALKLSPESSTDYRDHLWLGQLLGALGNRVTDAEAAYRRAIRLAPQAGEAWVGLVTFLASSKQSDKAATAAAEAATRLQVPEHAVALAICLEATGKPESAERVLTDALGKMPGGVQLQRQLAGLYLRRGDNTRAEPMLVALATGNSEVAGWARRHRAMLLLRTGGYAQVREALPFIEQNLKDAGGTPEDQRARAILLALQPGKRAEAVRALEESFQTLPTTSDEQMLLAQLYEAQGNWSAARERMQSIVSPGPRHLEHLITRLLHHDDASAAAAWLERLEKLEPDSWRTQAIKARVLTRLERGDEARTLLRQRIVASVEPSQILVIARLLEELGYPRDAEQGYLRYRVRMGGPGPQGDWPLARFHAVQGRVEDALVLMKSMGDAIPPDAVPLVAAAVVRAATLDATQSSRLDEWMAALRAKYPESSPILLACADIVEQRGNPKDAEALYERVLSREPRNVIALNNYAALLALSGRGRPALALANRAIDMLGPQPALLDTRGLAHLAANEIPAAVADLREAVALGDSPLRRFHLALAHRAAGNEAQFAENLALASTLTPSVLHPLERSKWREVNDH